MERRSEETRTGGVGRCPRCAATIRPGDLLIRYETSSGTSRSFAECPTCADVVHPSR